MMLIYAADITPRLQYILDVLLKDIAGINFSVTADQEIFQQSSLPKINYSAQRISDDEFFIYAHSLLFEKDIYSQTIHCFDFGGTKVFFKSSTESDFPFDIFAASFFLIARYEEYLPFTPDDHGRFRAEESLAFREQFLQRPVINIWLEKLKEALQKSFLTLSFKPSAFRFMPTYDIDIAYSYLHKEIMRNLGGLARDAVLGQWKNIISRIKVLMHLQKDPFDSYDWMNELHQRYKLQSIYFFLLGKHGRYDKNISPKQKALHRLIKSIAGKNNIGIHPSYQSFLNKEKVQEEINILSSIANQNVFRSRQHYIKMQLPQSYQLLCNMNIKEDYSMGYATHNGFRASICTPFYWYDLNKEAITSLKIFPFCFMESASFNNHQSPQKALKEKINLLNEVKKVNGIFISIWHNSSLGTDSLWKGWREMYEAFISRIDNKK